MAARYFLNIGTDWGDTANWSDTNGGAGGFSVPTNADDVFFTALSGNCTVNSTARSCKNLDFTGYSGTITLDFNLLHYGNITLSATMNDAGVGEMLYSATNLSVTSNGYAWKGVYGCGIENSTFTLNDNFTVNTWRWRTNSTNTLKGNTLKINVAYYNSNAGGGNIVGGTTRIEMVGSSCDFYGDTYSVISNQHTSLANPLVVNTSGTCTFHDGLRLKANSFTRTSGTIAASNMVFITEAATWNTGAITIKDLKIAIGTTTLTSTDITLTDLYQINNAGITINGSNLYVNGNIIMLSSNRGFDGTTTINYTGTGSWTSGLSFIKNNFIINTAGTLTISGNVYYGTRTLTYTTGAVVSSGGTLNLIANCTLNTSGMTWDTINVNAAFIVTINSTLSANTLILRNGACSFVGTAGFNVGTLTLTETLNANRTYTYKAGNTYNVTTSLVIHGNSTYKASFVSDTASSYAYLNLNALATQDVRYTNATDIDSSGGQTIRTTPGSVLTRTINWAYKASSNFFFFFQ